NINTTPTRNITLDTKTPSIEYAGGTAANATLFNRNWLFVNVSVSDTSFNNITFALYNGSTGAIINETNYTTLTTSINFTPLGEGNYLYNVTARDRAGNINYTATRNITLDTSTPSIDYAGGTEINASSFNRNWIFVNVSITETNFNNVTFALYNGSGGAILNETNYTILTAGSNFTTLGDGNYLYNVTARDEAGNVNYTAARNITLDSRTPSIDYAGGTEINATFFNRNWIFVNVSVTDINFNNITFALYNGSTGAILNETNYTTLTSSINFTPLGDGNYLYNVTARDSAGNENTTATRNITLDTRTPAIDYAGGTATDAATVSQSWIFVNVSIAEANFNNITFALHSGSTGAILNETNYTTLTTSTNFTSLADGSYKYNVTARDAAANQNKTATRSVTIDTSVAAPVAGGSTGGGGESGGGSGIAPPKKKVVVLVSAFEVSRSSLKYTTVERSELSDEIIIRNTGQTNITVSISSSLDSLLSLSASSLDILAGQQATLSLRISALEPGIYNGNIVLAADSVTKTIPVVIEVNSRTAAASMSIDVPSEHSIVTEGEALRAQVTLFALGDQHDLGVAVRYFIRSAEGSLITEEQEEFIFESQLSFVKEFDTRNLAPGGYIIGIEAASKEGIVVASSPFTVSRQLAASAPPHVAALSRYFAVSIIVFGVILLTFLGIIMHRRIRSGNRR
ncbi:Ig-like domain repeat protein, partial [Candidatus Woesearchaeota archaeon]|nr:Ig-like domain repeat protein [Candidatus Woesearchaeota archaeon]